MKSLSFLLRSCVLCAIVVFQWSCTDIDGFSDDNSVLSFRITQHMPTTVQLGEAEISADEIIIPILYGQEKFPLTFMADVECSKGFDRIEGADFSMMQTLETVNDRLEFLVVAQSGLTRRYVIKPQLTDYAIPEDIPFYVKSVSPEYIKVLGKARIVDDVMTLYVLEPEYPLSLVVLFDVDETVVGFEDFINGVTELNFENADSRLHFKLSDNSQNSKRDITLKIAPVSLVEGSHTSMDIYQRDLIIEPTKKSEGDFKAEGNRIDNKADSIAIFLTELTSPPKFPASLNIFINNLGNDIGFIDFGTEAASFHGYGQPQYFYMVDMEDMVARRWRIAAYQYEGEGIGIVTGADVLKFEYDYTASNVSSAIIGTKPSITLDKSIVYIYPEEGYIWLWKTGYNQATNKIWSLTLHDLNLELSEGATTDVTELYWEGNESWKTVRTFDVVSKDGKTKTWSVGIKDSADGLSGLTNILDVRLAEIYPVWALIDGGEPFTIDESQRTVTINMKTWDGCFDTDAGGNTIPMRFYLKYTLSPGAQVVSQDNNRRPLEFMSREDTAQVVVRAEDGLTEDIWTVNLEGTDEAASRADVLSFKLTSLPSAYFEAGPIDIDSSAGEIVINLNGSGSFPAAVKYSMTLSRSANASIATAGTYTFANMRSTMNFTVTNGSESKNWTVKFAEFAPQLKNGNLDSWNGDSPLPAGTSEHPFWAVANYLVSTTTAVSGVSGSAAQLKTGSILGKIASASIYLGWFDSANAIKNMNEPVKISFQGMEFAASKKITGFEADVKYLSVDYDSIHDTGVMTIELIKHGDRSTPYVYHGDDPSTSAPHADNTAVLRARGRMYLGNYSGTQNGAAINVVPSDSWTRVFVKLDYSSMSDPLDYTHLLIICASSSNGDVFKAAAGSTLTIDNITLIYE